MEIYFECTHCKEIEPINIAALSANGFGLQCSICKTYFTFGVVAVEHPLTRAATLSGLYNCQLCGEEKCHQPGICDDCLTLPTIAAQKKTIERLADALEFALNPFTYKTWPEHWTLNDVEKATAAARALLAEIRRAK